MSSALHRHVQVLSRCTPIRFRFPSSLTPPWLTHSTRSMLDPPICLSLLFWGNDFECDSVAAVITSIKIWFSHVKQEARHKFKSQIVEIREIGNFLSMCNILRHAATPTGLESESESESESRWVIAATQSLVININWAWKSSERMRTWSLKIAHNKDELIKRWNDRWIDQWIVRSIGRWKIDGAFFFFVWESCFFFVPLLLLFRFFGSGLWHPIKKRNWVRRLLILLSVCLRRRSWAQAIVVFYFQLLLPFSYRKSDLLMVSFCSLSLSPSLSYFVARTH